MAIPAIVDRQTLEQAVQSQFTTTTVVEYVLSAIPQVEADINANLRIRHQMGRATADIASRFTSLPSDFVGMIGIQLNTNPIRHMEFLTPDMMDIQKATYNVSDNPCWFTIIGDEIEVLPVPGSTTEVEISYYKALDALDADDAVNWLLTKYPHIYFNGVCSLVADYVMDQRKAVWQRAYERGIESMKAEDDKSRYPTGQINMRPRRAFT